MVDVAHSFDRRACRGQPCLCGSVSEGHGAVVAEYSRVALGCTIVAPLGEQIDVTIADFVADQRAPPPSAAAERVVPDREEW